MHLFKQTVYCLTSCCFFHVELLLHYSFLCITQLRYDSLFLLLFAFGALISGRTQFICIHLKPAGNQYLEYKSLKTTRDRASYDSQLSKVATNFLCRVFSTKSGRSKSKFVISFFQRQKKVFLFLEMKKKVSLFQLK